MQNSKCKMQRKTRALLLPCYILNFEFRILNYTVRAFYFPSTEKASSTFPGVPPAVG
jgi:hypothetical protein